MDHERQLIGALKRVMGSSHYSAHSFEGELIGKYLLHRQIGRGGMASVFLAERITSTNTDVRSSLPRASAQPAWVAVKVMHPHLLSEKKAIDRFIEEIGMTALLKHPNICSVLDLGEHKGIPYLVMPLLKGRSLAELLELSEAPPPEVVASIWIDLARGLSYAHNLKNHEGEQLAMIHRDISPHNAFVEYSGHAKLLDFGIAKLTPPGRREDTSPLMGKIAYMSPEQLEEEAFDHRIDIWSLAVTFWELCAHRPLFDANQPMRLMYQVLSDEISPPSAHRALPSVFDEISLRGLEREVERRPHDVLRWVSPVEEWLQAQLCPPESNASPSSDFDIARSHLVAEWMEGHFDLSHDILSAHLSPEEREERLALARSQQAQSQPSRPTPFSPLHNSGSQSSVSADERQTSSQELPLSSPLKSPVSSTSSYELLSDSPVSIEPYTEPQPFAAHATPPQPTAPASRPPDAKWTLALIALLAAGLLLLRETKKEPTGTTQTLKLSVGKERRGGVMLDSSPCPSKVYLMPSRKLLGQTPLSQTFKVGVYELRFEPLKRRWSCVAREQLIEIDEGKIQSYDVNLEQDAR